MLYCSPIVLSINGLDGGCSTVVFPWACISLDGEDPTSGSRALCPIHISLFDSERWSKDDSEEVSSRIISSCPVDLVSLPWVGTLEAAPNPVKDPMVLPDRKCIKLQLFFKSLGVTWFLLMLCGCFNARLQILLCPFGFRNAMCLLSMFTLWSMDCSLWT